MTAVSEKERVIYKRGRDRNFTKEEYEQINKEFKAAEKCGDDVELFRLFSLIPLDPKVVRAIAKVYGKDFIIEYNFDLTEANIAFGEGWLDEIEN